MASLVDLSGVQVQVVLGSAVASKGGCEVSVLPNGGLAGALARPGVRLVAVP